MQVREDGALFAGVGVEDRLLEGHAACDFALEKKFSRRAIGKGKARGTYALVTDVDVLPTWTKAGPSLDEGSAEAVTVQPPGDGGPCDGAAGDQDVRAFAEGRGGHDEAVHDANAGMMMKILGFILAKGLGPVVGWAERC